MQLCYWVAQSTNLGSKSDFIIHYLGTDLFVLKAKGNLMYFMESDLSPFKGSSFENTSPFLFLQIHDSSPSRPGIS